MKVIRNLEISAKDFFDELFSEVIKDMKENTDKNIQVSDFKKGFKYVFRSQEGVQRTTYEILDYEECRYFKAKRSSINATVIVSYQIVPSDSGIKVTFEQESSQIQTNKKGLFNSFSNTLYLGRMTDHLYNIQKNVINRREGIENSTTFNLFQPKKRKK